MPVRRFSDGGVVRPKRLQNFKDQKMFINIRALFPVVLQAILKNIKNPIIYFLYIMFKPGLSGVSQTGLSNNRFRLWLVPHTI